MMPKKIRKGDLVRFNMTVPPGDGHTPPQEKTGVVETIKPRYLLVRVGTELYPVFAILGHTPKREHRLMPGSIPRWVRCYDNAGLENETIDRYTVVYTGKYRTRGVKRGSRERTACDFQYLTMSGSPYHPQGFCQHGEAPYLIDARNGEWPPAIGRKNHLGKRIRFEDLPAQCQKVVLLDYRELWGLTA